MNKTNPNRRLFLKTGVLFGASLLFQNPLNAFPTENTEGVLQPKSFTNNPNLKTILSAEKWKGTPLDKEGRFMNHEFPFRHTMAQALGWKFFKRNPQHNEKKRDTFKQPVLKTDAFLLHNENTVVWLGHASFFVRINGVNILIDPVFDNIPTMKRHSDLPCEAAKFKNIDYILVSHSHFDHCDKETMKLVTQNNPNAKILTGLNLDKTLRRWSPNHEVQAAGWYQQFKTDSNIEVTYLPTRHWSKRNLNDSNKTLWGSFIIKSGEKTVYFAADSGYGSHFKEVGELFPNIDVTMIGIGAYSPRWFMHVNHQDPEQAAQAFNETGAKLMVPMHYGTFNQTDEPASEPLRLMQEIIANGKVKNQVKSPQLGEDVFY